MRNEDYNKALGAGRESLETSTSPGCKSKIDLVFSSDGHRFSDPAQQRSRPL